MSHRFANVELESESSRSFLRVDSWTMSFSAFSCKCRNTNAGNVLAMMSAFSFVIAASRVWTVKGLTRDDDDDVVFSKPGASQPRLLKSACGSSKRTSPQMAQVTRCVVLLDLALQYAGCWHVLGSAMSFSSIT